MTTPQDPSPEFIYHVHHIPKDNPILLSYLAGKFASLKLNAVQIEKAAFSATFASESIPSFTSRIEKLKLPHIHTFIAVAYPNTTPPPQQTIDRGDFIGCLTLIGPIPKTTYEWPESGGRTIGSDEEETKWQMTGVYTSPNHRSHGVGKLLINSACEFAVRQSSGRASRVRACTHPLNRKALELYLKLEFERAGTCNRFEAQKANEEVLPDRETMDPGVWFQRIGPVLERTSLGA
ncbi:hypothetical protein HYFRA_00013509 [Hymenoscyphus fraxineus]|uniref:N-acetyltransferase domain-containing protein n=1 Tax=Hymenoscyphus fraxineus TaxID=746836 RepID=A0A9N9L8V4_9HELO|nr:hypothetical protein HYFRA_00013509 [Hymenoscyphus fraxineus]